MPTNPTHKYKGEHNQQDRGKQGTNAHKMNTGQKNCVEGGEVDNPRQTGKQSTTPLLQITPHPSHHHAQASKLNSCTFHQIQIQYFTPDALGN